MRGNPVHQIKQLIKVALRLKNPTKLAQMHGL